MEEEVMKEWKALTKNKGMMYLIAGVLTIINSRLFFRYSYHITGAAMFQMLVTGGVTLAFYYANGCIRPFFAIVKGFAHVGAAIGGVLGALTAWMMGLGFLFTIMIEVFAVMIVLGVGGLLAYIFPIAMYPFLSFMGKHISGYNTVPVYEEECLEQEEVNWDSVYSRVMDRVNK